MRRIPVAATLALVVLVGCVVAALVLVGQATRDRLSDDGSAGADRGLTDLSGAVEDGAPDGGIPGSRIERPAPVAPDATPARVVQVIDGDTIHVVPVDGPLELPVPERERIRLLNIDAPELRDPQRGRDCGAGTATERLEALLDPPAIVWLAADVEEQDRFGRSLRYVWSATGVDVQRDLVEAGLAEVLVVGPNDRFAPPLFASQSDARAQARGIWGASCLD